MMYPLDFEIGRQVVIHHDQEGLPYDMSLEVAQERRYRVGLLGILIEASRRKLSTKLLKEIVRKWLKLFAPTEAEKKAVQHLLGEEI